MKYQQLSNYVAWFARGMFTVVFPHRCVLCHAEGKHGAKGDNGHDMCAACEADLLRNQPACLQCAQPLAHWAVCGHCQRQPPVVAGSAAPFKYQYPLDSLIKAYKFNGKQVIGRELGRLFADALQAGIAAGRFQRPDGLLPVPLHHSRQRDRGFNQSQQFARQLGLVLDIPVFDDVVIRERPTEAQSNLPFDQRRRNIRDAFKVVGDLPCKHMALVDDVITTGSTVNELARLLERAGAERVDAWALARVGR